MDIENFIAEFKKTFVYDMLKDYVSDEKLFDHVVEGTEVIWMKEQTRQMWSMWQATKAQAIPEGFVLVKKRNMIGNPNVDWLQAPKWAKYWLKDGHSNKYWWSSTRPIKDMDLQAFCWRGDYFAEEAPSFNFAGSWDKSLTSKKAMIEAQEQAK